MRTKRILLAGAALAACGLAGCQTWFGGLTLPSGRYLDRHFPQYFSPDPDFPLPRELASLEDPEGAAVRAGGVGGVVPVAPAAPVPIGPGAPGAAPVPGGPALGGVPGGR